MKDTEIIFLEQIRQEQKLGSEIAALHFVLKEYQTLREEEALISKAIKNMKKKILDFMSDFAGQLGLQSKIRLPYWIF